MRLTPRCVTNPLAANQAETGLSHHAKDSPDHSNNSFRFRVRMVEMLRAKRIVVRTVRIFLASALCAWAAYSLHLYATLPPSSWARRCGNCFLGSFGIAIEAGIMGLLLLWLTFAPPAQKERHLVVWTWVFLIVGVALTAFVIGLPIFFLCALQLIWIAAKATVRQAARC